MSRLGRGFPRKPIAPRTKQAPAAAAFPTTGVLDTFNRADESIVGQPGGVNWTSDFCPAGGSVSAGLRLQSNQLSGSDATPAWTNSYWNQATFGPDVEVFATVAALPSGSTDEILMFGLRLVNIGLNATDGYCVALVRQAAAGDQYIALRLDNSNQVTLAAGIGSTSQKAAAGDKYGVSMVGSTLKLWAKYGASPWAIEATWTDSTYSAAGRIGVEMYGTTARLDDFGGGVPVSGPVTYQGVSLVQPSVAITTAGRRGASGAATVSLTDARTTAGTRTTFSTASVALSDARTTAGARTTASSSSVALSDARTTAGTRTTFSSSSVALTDARTTAGTRKVPGAATVALTDARTTAGTRTTFSSSSVALSDIRTTAGTRRTTSASSVALVAARTTAGLRTTFSAAVVALGAARGTAGVRRALAAASVALAVARTTAGRLTARASSSTQLATTVTSNGSVAGGPVTHFGVSTTALTDVRVTAGSRHTASAAIVSVTAARTTAGRLGARSASTTALTATITTVASRSTSSASTTALTATRTTVARLTAKSASVSHETVTVTSAGETAGNVYGAVTVALGVGVTTAGSFRHYGSAALGLQALLFTDSLHVKTGSATSELLVTISVDAGVGVPLLPGWLDTPSAGYLAPARAGQLERSNGGGYIAPARAGRVERVDEGVLV